MSVDDIKRKFLPRFAILAKERIDKGLDVAMNADGDETLVLAREMHSMAGEAGLLGLPDLVVLARAAEVAATQLHGARVPSKRTALQRTLLDLHEAVVLVERQIDLDEPPPSSRSRS